MDEVVSKLPGSRFSTRYLVYLAVASPLLCGYGNASLGMPSDKVGEVTYYTARGEMGPNLALGRLASACFLQWIWGRVRSGSGRRVDKRLICIVLKSADTESTRFT